jgi:hypothetical protein
MEAATVFSTEPSVALPNSHNIGRWRAKSHVVLEDLKTGVHTANLTV